MWGHSMFNDCKRILKRNGLELNQKIIGADSYEIYVDWGLATSGVCYSSKTFMYLRGFVNNEIFFSQFRHNHDVTFII